MRASSAVGLLVVSSMSIFGIYGRHTTHPALAPGPEPVYVNGQVGVYNPDSGEFVSSNSPEFDDTCDLIQQRREWAAGNYNTSSGYYHHWYYSSVGHTYVYSTGGASAARSSTGSFSRGYASSSSSSIGSTRGGIGGTAHAMGAAHS